MKAKFVFVGGGGHCQSCINTLELAGGHLIGILDAHSSEAVLGYPIIGTDDDIVGLSSDPNLNFIVTVGMIKATQIREKVYSKLVAANANRLSLVAKSATISNHVTIGKSCAILENVNINANSVIGDNVIINTSAIIEHGANIGNHTHISTSAVVNGDVHIGSNCMIGSGAIILQGITISDNVTIGAGSVVTKDILESGVWVGSPAREL